MRRTGHTLVACDGAEHTDTPSEHEGTTGFADRESLDKKTDQGKSNDVADTAAVSAGPYRVIAEDWTY